MSEHLDKIGHADTVLPLADVSTGWHVNVAGQVWGPCPRCHGNAWGPPNSEIPELNDATTQGITTGQTVQPPSGSAQVLVACRCGHKHGDEDGSCGWHSTIRYTGSVLIVENVSPADDDAARIVQKQRVSRLAETRKRAQNWLAGNAAILALLGSALVFQAPDDISKLKTAPSVVVLVLALAGLAALAISIYFAYAAAYGGAAGTAVDRIVDADRSDYNGLGSELETAVRADVAASRSNLLWAVWLAIAGVIAVAAAAALAGVLPQEKDDSASSPAKPVCIKAGSAIVKLAAAPDVVTTGTVQFASCPAK